MPDKGIYLAVAIDKAVDAGIPVVVYDGDISNSKRHAFIGTNWYEIGRTRGEEMVGLLGGKGKVAILGLQGMENMEDGYRGFREVLKEYSGMEIIGQYDDHASPEEAARIASDVISAHPDIAGFCDIDAPAIATVIKETGNVGKIVMTNVDMEPEHIQLVKEGLLQVAVGQKRKLFGYHGAQMLYDMVNKPFVLSKDDDADGVTNVPYKVDTGLIVITKSNDHLYEGLRD